ncbi:MAG: DUF4019 domain-containing protein [Gemmatimonadaceae bacterium]
MADYDLDAERAAREWLALADVADAAGTWGAAASLFRDAVPEEEWARSLRAARAPLGPVVARTLRTVRAVSELPGAPDGQYVVLEFDTQFERKRAAVETVTPMRDRDGAWRVSGYYIR